MGVAVSNAAWNTSDHHLIACNSLGLWPRVPYKGVLYANRKPRSPGFNADPSMIRVGDTYYIANSTFEWFPGVRLHESKDMVHWNLLPSPLSRTSQLDMRGNPSSGGIWAPDLSYADGKFWLIYTDVKVVNGAFKDCTNYLVTAESIHGPWSEPIRVNGVGFDASLFHDDDGRKYLVQQTWDFREYHHGFDGITLTEFDVKTMKLKPETERTIWRGTDVKLTEDRICTKSMAITICSPLKAVPCIRIRKSWPDPSLWTRCPSKACRRIRSSRISTRRVPVCKSRGMARWSIPRPANGITPRCAVVRGITTMNPSLIRAAGARWGVKPPSRRSSGPRMAGRILSEAMADSVMWMLEGCHRDRGICGSQPA